VEWTDAFPWRPFCSERCKLIDLGAWAAEKHAIPGEVVETDDSPRSDRKSQDEDGE
jgi:endogenous inhibitor of DNA gyrase (YacG/DUF329 family)